MCKVTVTPVTLTGEPSNITDIRSLPDLTKDFKPMILLTVGRIIVIFDRLGG